MKLTFQEWFSTSPFASFLRTFAAILLSSAVADFVRVGSFEFSNWQAWAIAGVSAALPAFLRWLNPQDVLSLRSKG